MSHFNTYNSTRTVREDGEAVTNLETNQIGDLSTTLNTSLDDTNDSITVYPKCSEVNLTASGLVKTGAGNVYGIIVSSHTSGTIKLWDNTAGSGTVVVDTMTLGASERWIPLFGMAFGTGLYVTIGGTANITIAYK
jgi:hypothetical protein